MNKSWNNLHNGRFQNPPFAMVEFVYQAIVYKCLATPVFKTFSVYLASCSCYVRLTWNTGKPAFHSIIATIHTSIVVEQIKSQMTDLGHVITDVMLLLIARVAGLCLEEGPILGASGAPFTTTSLLHQSLGHLAGSRNRYPAAKIRFITVSVGHMPSKTPNRLHPRRGAEMKWFILTIWNKWRFS